MTARDDLARVLDEATCPQCGHHAFYHHPLGSCGLTTYGAPEDGFQPAEPCSCDTPFGESLTVAVICKWLPTYEAGVGALVEAVLAASCHHCGRLPDDDGAHSCPCPLSDSECLQHTGDPVVSLNAVRAALRGEA